MRLPGAFHPRAVPVLPLLLPLLAIAACVLWVEAAPPPQSADAGKTLFLQKCAACHSAGTETVVGPGLQYETLARPKDWLARWIAAPDKLIAQGDPLAVGLVKLYNGVQMPNLGLTDAEVADVIAYLATLPGGGPAAAAAQPTAAAAPPLPPGSPAAGLALFDDAVAFQNGGPPCAACHTTAGLRGLGGGLVGPDLTHAFTKYGAAGLPSVLANITFPTMAPVFAGHALTPQEQSDLVAFLKQADSAGPAAAPPTTTLWVAVWAIVGVIVLLVVAQLAWRRRLTTVRRSLTETTGTRP